MIRLLLPLLFFGYTLLISVRIFFSGNQKLRDNEVKMRSFQAVIEICASYSSSHSFWSWTFCNHHKSTNSSSINLNVFQFMAWNLLFTINGITTDCCCCHCHCHCHCCYCCDVCDDDAAAAAALAVLDFRHKFFSSSSSSPLIWWFNMFHQMTQKPHLLEVTLFTHTRALTHLAMMFMNKWNLSLKMSHNGIWRWWWQKWQQRGWWRCCFYYYRHSWFSIAKLRNNSIEWMISCHNNGDMSVCAYSMPANNIAIKFQFFSLAILCCVARELCRCCLIDFMLLCKSIDKE